MSNFGTRNSGFFGGASGGGGGVGTLQQVTDLGASSTNTLTLSGANGIFTDPINGFYSLGFGNSNLGGGGFETDFSFANTIFSMGQYSGLGNACEFVINDNTGQVQVKIGGVAEGINLDIINRFFYFGSTNAFNAYLNFDGNIGNAIYYAESSNQFICDTLLINMSGGSQLIQTSFGNLDMGFRFDYPANEFLFGDYNNEINSTKISIFDATKIIEFNSGLGKYKFNNVATYATNALAVAGGLVTGNIYKSAAGVLSIVL